MTDEKFTFVEDVKEKKIASRSARNRIAHTGKGGKVRFPHDNLTRKELEAMNGELRVYRMNDPIMLQDEVVNDYIHSDKNEKFKRAAEHIVEAAQQLCKEHGEHIATLLRSRETETQLEAVKAAWYSLPDEDREKIVSVVRASIVGVES